MLKVLACLIFTVLLHPLLAAEAPAPAPGKAIATSGVWAASVAVTGSSKNPAREAGLALSSICAGRSPDLVLFFQFLRWPPGADRERKQTIDELAESFEKPRIFGIATGPVCATDGTSGRLGILALGGVQHSTVTVRIEPGKETEAYAEMAARLKEPYAKAKDSGRLILILGSCEKLTKAEGIVSALQGALGKDAPLFGPGTPETTHIAAGNQEQNALTAILVTGDFRCDFAMHEAQPNTGEWKNHPERFTNSAREGMDAAIGNKKDDIAAILVASFTNRGHTIEHTPGTIKEEGPIAEAARATTGALLFGWDYTAEIGIPKTGEPAIASIGNHFKACVIRKGAK